MELLVVDAEGHDDVALRQFPLRTLPTARLIFEAKHLGAKRYHRVARMLRAHGFVNLWGDSPGAALSTWHHAQSS